MITNNEREAAEPQGTETMNQNQMHEACNQYLYQFIQIQMNDGTTYQGMLHSFDKDHMYLIMANPNTPQNQSTQSNDNRFFPFFGPFGLFGFPFFGIRWFSPFFPFW